MGYFSGPFLRLRHVPKPLKDGRALTERDHKRVVALLAGKNANHMMMIPTAALRAVGVNSTDDLELEVTDGAIVLKPKVTARTTNEPEAPL